MCGLPRNRNTRKKERKTKRKEEEENLNKKALNLSNLKTTGNKERYFDLFHYYSKQLINLKMEKFYTVSFFGFRQFRYIYPEIKATEVTFSTF